MDVRKLFIGLILLSGLHLKAQDTHLVLPAGPIRMDALGERLFKTAGISFAFNSSRIPAGTLVRIPHANPDMATLLRWIGGQLHVHFRLYGNHVIVFNDQAPSAQSGASTRHTRTTAKRPAGLSPNEAHASPDSSAPKALILQPITDTTRPGFAPGKSIQLPAPHIGISTRPHPGPGLFAGKAFPRVGLQKAFIQAGLQTDETLYFSPTLEAGLPFLYAEAAWNTNFQISGARYGIGTSVNLGKGWKALLDITAGNLSKNYQAHLDTSYMGDTLMGIGVKSRLYQLRLGVEKAWGQSFRFQAGPTLNRMQTSYVYPQNADPDVIVSLLQQSGINEADAYYTIKPPYASGGSGSTRLWIGFQVSLFYFFELGRRG